MNTPVHTEAEARSRNTFKALIWAFSRPGIVYQLPEHSSKFPDNFFAIAETVLDLESSFFTEDIEIADFCTRTTARRERIEEAEYVFLPNMGSHDIELVEKANRGTMIYPDRSATIIMNAVIGAGPEYTFTGPGIETMQTIRLDKIPNEFWRVREKAMQYPIGWDVLFVDGGKVVGIPRTTHVDQHLN